MRLALALALGLTVSLIANVQSGGTQNEKVEAQLRAQVASWDAAYVKGDTATLDGLLAPEFSFVGGPKKADYLASFKSRTGYVQSAISTEIQVEVYGNSAILTGIDSITVKSKDQVMITRWLYMDVWINRKGIWQCVKTYSSPITR